MRRGIHRLLHFPPIRHGGHAKTGLPEIVAQQIAQFRVVVHQQEMFLFHGALRILVEVIIFLFHSHSRGNL